MVRSYRDRPHDTVVIVMLLYDSRHRSRHADAVTSHHDRMILHVLVFIISFHRFAVLGPELEHLAHLDTSRMLYRRTAHRTRISCRQHFDIRNDVSLVISAVVDIDQMMILLARTCTQVFETRKLTVHNDPAVMQRCRACESADTACSR